jgi:hypothetical protein
MCFVTAGEEYSFTAFVIIPFINVAFQNTNINVQCVH